MQGDLTTLVDAECYEWRGLFIPRISEILSSLSTQKSWVISKHDKDLMVFRGERHAFDLMTASIVSKMSDALYRLGDKIPKEVRELSIDAIQRRAISPFVSSLLGEEKEPWWLRSRSNWNAVCLNGITSATLRTVEDKRTRALVLAAAEHYSRYYLESFLNDGYAVEGIGYWQYGFRNYTQLRDQILASTEGDIDLLESKAAQLAALFPFRFSMAPGIYASFGDSKFMGKPEKNLIDYVSYIFGSNIDSPITLETPSNVLPKRIGRKLVEDLDPGSVSFFEDAGVLVVRPQTPGKLALTAKGGGNASHSHNDIGSFSIAVSGTQPLGDPGGPRYYDRKSFSKKRYTRPLESSFGHPVPIIAGQVQVDARSISPKVSGPENSNGVISMTIDMTDAYNVRELKNFTRTFEYHSSRDPEVRVIDKFDMDGSDTITESFPTHGSWWQEDEKTLSFIYDGASVIVRFLDAIPSRIYSDKISQNGSEFEVVRANFDVSEKSTISISISER
ncbi:heparinase II/III domain-containing protein [Salipiger thiooxidans]|uniref:heparinase II/III domain-containing protein n=1 Tax=Salipiger thiooxidans TaxID=282683 RepID=UPI001CD2AE39|nr:heparinase II/III family protein [Salipiger thiooxidans]MCA0849970.1 heparinase II/III-family protein [Salipiger thiooxidans]